MCKYLIISFPEIQSNSEDWTIVVQSLRSEKLKLTQALNAMMAEKESLAISLEGNLLVASISEATLVTTISTTDSWNLVPIQ